MLEQFSRLCLEKLEDRRLLTATYYPAQIRTAYGINEIAFGGVTGDGAGQTIAIVDAGDDAFLMPTTNPNYATSDLAQFDLKAGLADPPSFTKVSQTVNVVNDPSGAWQLEEALDIEWVHAIAPAANIILVECNYSSNTAQLFSNLATAASYAATLPNVSVVSMSWGSVGGGAGSPGEFAGEAAYDSQFTTPSNHPNVTFLAATGDNGYGEYPAFSPNVVAVGGTSLYLNKDNTYSYETYWNGGGSSAGHGTSTSEALPAFQAAYGYTNSGRVVPDVVFDADPGTPVWVYNSYHNVKSPWQAVAGTSLGAPVWAALVAIANQGRALAGAAPLDGASQTLPALYSLPSSDYNLITNANSSLSTGLGSPKANLLVADLAAFGLGDHLSVTAQPPSSVVAGSPLSFTVEALNSGGKLDASFAGAATASGGGVLSQANFVNGVAVFSATLNTAGAGVYFTVSVAGLTTKTQNLSVVAGSATQLIVASQPTSVAVGSPFNIVVDAEDNFGNIDTSFQRNLQIVLASNPGGSTLGGPLSTVFVSGVASFSGLTLNQPGDGYTLAVSSFGLPMAFSNAFSETVTLHAPNATGATTYQNIQSASGLVITPNALDTKVVTNFQVTAITGGTLFQNDGVTTINMGDFITVAQAAAGLKFTPTQGSTIAGGFTVQESTSASATGLGGPTASPPVTVLPIPPATNQVIDDSSATGFSATSDWLTASGAGFSGGVHYMAAGGGGSKATWTFQVAPGQYQVYASWPGGSASLLASNAPYTIADGSTDLGTELVNQQLPADGAVYAGFQKLGTFNFQSGTLVVTLTNNANNQVMADSVRIVGGGIPLVFPQIRVAGNQQTIGQGDNQPIIDDGTNFGAATIGGAPLVETFKITNTGLTPLNLGGSPPVGLSGSTDFSIVSQPSVSSLAPGASTTLQVKFAPTAAIAETATLSIVNNDASQANPFVFEIAGTGLPSNIQIIDNGHPGYSNDVTWLDQAQVGFEGHTQYHPAGSSTAVANWSFTGLAAGQYQVYATWPGGFSVLSASATYSITDGLSAQSATVNQQHYPNGVPYLNANWQLLATLTVQTGTLQVSLSSVATGGIVAADAIAIIDLSSSGGTNQPRLGPSDTNSDGLIEPLDALIIINALNLQATNPNVPADATNYVPLDALKIINYLNAPAPPAGSPLISWSMVGAAVQTATAQTAATVQSATATGGNVEPLGAALDTWRPAAVRTESQPVSLRQSLVSTLNGSASTAQLRAAIRSAALAAQAVDALFAQSGDAAPRVFMARRILA